MDGLQRGSAAIVGVAESDLGAVAAEMSPIDLMAQGIHRALADCGLGLRDVDGLICATAQSRTSGLNLAEYLGISPAFVDTTILGGSSFMFTSLMPRRRCSSGCASRGHRLWQYPAHDRAASRLGARI